MILALLGSGCEGPSPPGAEPQGLFPEGVPVLVAEPEVRVGDDQGLQLSLLSGMFLHSTGKLLVSDRLQRRVHVIDAESGELLGTVGQPDEGPGRLIAPASMGEDSLGRIWVAGGNELNVFEEEGTRFRHVARITGEQLHASEGRAFGMLPPFMADGPAIRFAYLRWEGMQPASSMPTTSMVVARVDIDGNTEVVSGLPPVSNSLVDAIEIVRVDDPQQRVSRIQVYGAPPLLWAHAPDGRMAQGHGRRYEVQLFSPHGEPIHRIVGPEPPPVPLSEAEKVVHSERFPPLVLAEAGLRAEGFYTPEFKNPVWLLSFDEDNRLWVQFTVPDESPIRVAHVYDTEGRLSHVAVWPEEINFLGGHGLPYRAIKGDHAWGTTRDELDVITLVRLRFRPLYASYPHEEWIGEWP